MRRVLFTAALAAFLLPSTADAQLRFIAGGGISSQTGDFNDVAEIGYHGRLGVQLGVPVFPLAGRLEGEYHSFAQAGALPKGNVLNGALSAVLSLGGVGITPYFLAGIGRYRVDLDVAGTVPVNEKGFHGGFGLNLGAVGLGGFAEVRVVQINSEGNKIRYFPLSIGLRM